jgi:hypothetical protein
MTAAIGETTSRLLAVRNTGKAATLHHVVLVSTSTLEKVTMVPILVGRAREKNACNLQFSFDAFMFTTVQPKWTMIR